MIVTVTAIPSVNHCPLKDRLSKVFFELSTVSADDVSGLPEYNINNEPVNTPALDSSDSAAVGAPTPTPTPTPAAAVGSTDNYINFRDFLLGLSLFNSPGNSDLKIRLAFRLQDFDDDGELCYCVCVGEYVWVTVGEYVCE